MKTGKSSEVQPASALIDERIKELSDWRGEMLAELRRIIHDADPEIVEEWKWRGVPVWSHGGIVCTGESYKKVVKLTFAQGAALADPTGCLTRAWRAMSGGLLMSMREKRSTRRH